MSAGKLIAGGLVILAAIGGVAMYWLQVHAYYEELPAQDTIMMTPLGGGPVALPVRNFRGIDADTSPLRYRACFTLAAPTATLLRHRDPTPLNAPHWFDCFDAGAIGDDLGTGAARAYVAEANIEYGFDRVVAVYPDGRAFAWHQMNRCGEAVYDGLPPPPGCPPPPEDV